MKKIFVFLLSMIICLTSFSCADYKEPIETAKAIELREQYDFYDKSVKEIKKGMKVTDEQADEIFIILVSYCGLDNTIRSCYAKSGKENTYSYYWTGSAKTYEVVLDDGIVSEVRYSSTVLYPVAEDIPEIIETETSALIEATITTEKSTEALTQAPTEKTVYITKTGTKYHKSSCSHVKDGCTAILLSEAQRNGYEPCGVCKP